MTFWQLLTDFLLKANRNITMKAREQRLSKVEDYLRVLEAVQQDMILNTTYISFFDSMPFDFPSLEDVHEVKTLENSDILQFIVILNHALSQYIDTEKENLEPCQKLYAYYKLLKKEAINRNPNYPKEDGFLDYLNSRNERLEQKAKLEKARVEGNICIHCGSENVKSYGNMWKCFDCKRKFRKHN